MTPLPPHRLVSFSDVAFKGNFRRAFIVLLLVAVIGIAAGAAVAPTQPPGYFGTAESRDIAIEVPGDAQPPVKVEVSHGFVLVTTPYSGSYAVEDGFDEITYRITVENEAGDEVAEESSRLSAPVEHTFSRSDTKDTVVVKNEHEFHLQPGKYIVTLNAIHPLDYKIAQTSKYFVGGALLMGAGFIAVILMFGLVLLALFKRDSLRRSQLAEELRSAPPEPPMLYQPGIPAAGLPGQPGEPYAGAPPAPAYPGAPMPGSGGASSLEYVPGHFYAEIVCTRCGFPIRSPPFNGVVTCEHCGEQGLVT